MWELTELSRLARVFGVTENKRMIRTVAKGLNRVHGQREGSQSGTMRDPGGKRLRATKISFIVVI